jgi:beta-xylosidase
MMKEMKFLILSILLCTALGCTQETQFSEPYAPVGNKELTVPAVVSPILDQWMRDTFVMHGPDGYYYMTGTTATPGRHFPNKEPHCWDYNDGLYLWRSKDMKDWESMGRIWSFEEDAAAWQRKGKPVKAGAKSLNGDPLDSIYRAVWAPEIHYIKSQKQWMVLASLNGGRGSFILRSTSGKPEGPYENIEGNANGPIYPKIDISLFEENNGEVYLVAHNHFIAKMKHDLSDIAEPFRRFEEKPYSKEPYIEGVYLTKHHGKYQLLQTVWSVKQEDDSYSYIRREGAGKNVHSYDVVVAEADNIYGPYGPRYPAILEGGHNNLFVGKDGEWWSTTFFNPRGTRAESRGMCCRPAVVPVKWEAGKLMPDRKRSKQFYKAL